MGFDCSGYHCLTCNRCLAGPASMQTHAEQGHAVQDDWAPAKVA
jgi:hypothetical protein